MYFKQFYLGCLAHASYLIGSNGEAAVVDPQRDVDQYIQEADAQNLKIKYVIETHLHADFVSGHRELAERTGARVAFGRRAGAAFPHIPLKDGDRLQVGQIRLDILETPGHTPESICIVVCGEPEPYLPQKVLTGDTLFIGDIGRPDLAGSKGFAPEQMAAMLYDSLHDKLLRLADDVEVYPAHGAGSLCGRNMSNETWSTLGQQRRFNYALQPMDRDAFVRMMTTDLPEVPAYFSRDAELNRAGAPALDHLPKPAVLQPAEVHVLAEEGSLVLDVRPAAVFGNSHIHGALNIALGGQFASWAGALIPLGTPIILITDERGEVDEAVTRLARVGIDTVKGFLECGMSGWERAGLPAASIVQMPVEDLKNLIEEGRSFQLIDVRHPSEYSLAHAPGAVNAPLTRLEKELGIYNSGRPTAVICRSGYRSSAATSILERHGFGQIFNVAGGTAAWVEAGYRTEGAA